MKNRLIKILKATLSFTTQIAAVVVIIVVGFVAYNMGAGQRMDSMDTMGKVDGGAMAHDHNASTQEPKLAGYACAMNCVPPLPEPGDCPICGMEMQPVYEDSAASEGNSERRLTMSRAAAALANVQTSPVTLEVPRRNIRLVGQLSIDTSRRAHISADVGGRVDKLAAEYEGDRVSQGEDLVLLYSPELLAVQQEFLQAQRALERLPEDALPAVREASRAAIDASRERLRLAGLQPAQIEDIAASGTAKEQVTIEAPIGGTVIQRHAEEGQYVGKGERILTIANLDVLWGELEAYESDLPWLRIGDPMTFTTDSVPGRAFSGEVAWIDPVMNNATRTTRIRVNIDNESGLLKPGMYVTGEVEATLGDGEMPIIPKTAPLITGERAVVYVEVPNTDRPTFEGREVILGPRTMNGYVVVKGLKTNERVVTNGNFQIDSALQIIAKPSMMSPQGESAMVVEEDEEGEGEEKGEGDEGLSREQYAAVLPHYIESQRGLANDDFEAAMAGWKKMTEAASDFAVHAFHEELNVGLNAGDIAALRVAFEPVSMRLIALAEEHGNPLETVLQKVNCPMAFDWKGADWLQSEEDVFNPYFGEEMLVCGQIMKEWPAQ